MGALQRWGILIAAAAVFLISAPATVSAAESPSFLLEWSHDQAEEDFSHFNIYRYSPQEGASDFSTAPTYTDIHDTSYVDSSIVAGLDYYYIVTAVDTAGNESDPSNEVGPVVYTEMSESEVVPDAGEDETVSPNQVVTLDGSATQNPGGQTLSWFWELLDDRTDVAIADEFSQVTTFVAPLVDSVTTLTFQLSVLDEEGAGLGTPAQVRKIVVPGAAANAGEDQNVAVGDVVTLDSSGTSSTYGTLEGVLWKLLDDRTDVTIDDEFARTTTFVAPNVDEVTTLTFQLTVWMTLGVDVFEVSDEVCVVVHPQFPIADAGDGRKVGRGERVVLDGSRSHDPNGATLEYLWLLSADTPIPVQIADDTSCVTSFVAPNVTEQTTLTFLLYVWDEDMNQCVQPGRVSYMVITKSPLADAGADRSVTGVQTVTLDGSSSVHPDGLPLTYTWTQTGGEPVLLEGADTPVAWFSPPRVGFTQTLTFELMVTDGTYSSVDEVQVQILAGEHPETSVPSQWWIMYQ